MWYTRLLEEAGLKFDTNQQQLVNAQNGIQVLWVIITRNYFYETLIHNTQRKTNSIYEYIVLVFSHRFYILPENMDSLNFIFESDNVLVYIIIVQLSYLEIYTLNI